MDRRKLIIVAIFFVLLAGGVFVAPVVVRRLRDPVIGQDPAENADEVIPVSPTALLLTANEDLLARGEPIVTKHEYALARALRSEHGSGSVALRTWVAWAIKNAAPAGNVFRRLTYKRNSAHSGKFARQRADGRFAATNRAPRLSDIKIARAVLRAQSGDPTRKSDHFFSPRAQDKLFAQGKVRRNAADQRKKWIEQFGWQPRGRPAGVSPRTVEFFASGKVA